MNKTLVLGHKKPDTDSICSALVYASLKRELGLNAEAVKLGTVNKETQYVLEYFGVKAPRLIEKVEEGVTDVILVDHNEFQQSVDNINELKIVEVIDHHRIANFETADPLYFRAEPVGCTATIIRKIYNEKGLTISKENAGLLLSAIVSDTLLFKSPTCMKEDIEAAEKLAEIANVNLEEYGLAMLKAGTNLEGQSTAELISMDSKEFTMGEEKVEIAQINVVDIHEVYRNQEALESEIAGVINEKGLALFLLVVTDILNNDSEILAVGNGKTNVEEAFDVQLDNNRAFLKGVVSRKKQIVTTLTNTFMR